MVTFVNIYYVHASTNAALLLLVSGVPALSLGDIREVESDCREPASDWRELKQIGRRLSRAECQLHYTCKGSKQQATTTTMITTRTSTCMLKLYYSVLSQ